MNSLHIDKAPRDTRVVVAMSGGVDSSVTAAMLKAEGYDVVGITLQLYDHGMAVEKAGACCAGRDIRDAREVAEKIGIPHYVLNYENRFKESVIDDFAKSYRNGETPIPCIKCNEKVKFRDLLDTAEDLEADVLVTGHYARLLFDSSNQPMLFRGSDYNRDQSYFLFAITKERLAKIRFPLGDIPKPTVRKMAEEFGLKVFSKPDSQDICFVPNGHYSKVVQKVLGNIDMSGNFIDIETNKIVGVHSGYHNFTIGQKKGITLYKNSPFPYYIIKIDPKTHNIFVGDKKYLGKNSITLRNVYWIGDKNLSDITSIEIHARIRSSGNMLPARLETFIENNNILTTVYFDTPVIVSPGQACVFYNGDRVLGGGWVT